MKRAVQFSHHRPTFYLPYSLFSPVISHSISLILTSPPLPVAPPPLLLLLSLSLLFSAFSSARSPTTSSVLLSIPFIRASILSLHYTSTPGSLPPPTPLLTTPPPSFAGLQHVSVSTKRIPRSQHLQQQQQQQR